MARHVDPHRFMVVGCVTDWAAIAKTQEKSSVEELIRERGLETPRAFQLRWFFDPGMGYPRTPFTVWTRLRNQDAPVPITASPVLLAGVPTLVLDEVCVEVTVEVSGGPGGAIIALNGMPFASSIVDIKPLQAGATVARLSGPEIRTLVVPAGTTVDAVHGQLASVADDKGWTEIEIVGLPGDGRGSTGTDLLSSQGLVSALTDPVSAALDRYRRGAPFYGWESELEPGVGAPAWTLADPKLIIGLFQQEMLSDFVTMVDSGTGTSQQAMTFDRTIITPTGQQALATFNPLKLLVYGATTDPLDSLITGFGTAYDASMVQSSSSHGLTHAFMTTPSILDFMVTATFVDSFGSDVEWAALLLGGPTTSLPPSRPAAVSAASVGLQSPEVMDGPYRPVVTVDWDAPPATLPFHLGSHSFARRGITPPAGAAALMIPRPGDIALQPIGSTISTVRPSRRSLSDSAYAIDGVAGLNTVRFSVASQDIFGRWSPWGSASCDTGEPTPGRVTLTGALLDTILATGPCPAILTVDVTWDWANRSPRSIDLVGRLFQQVWPQDRPADTTAPTVPGALLTSGAGVLASIEFAPDGSIVSILPGSGLAATVQHLSADARDIVVMPISDRAPRRYRVTVSGFALDFDVADSWGLALWARGTERIPPGRVGPWNTAPVVASAGDPRPPVMQSSYELVQLASMRDSEGLHHANLTWVAMPGAVGYHIYTSAESMFRSLTSMPVVAASQTLQARLAELRTKFQATPERRPFARSSSQTFTGTTAAITLPRGTKDIHMFVVLGVSGGGVESDWPVATDPLCGRRFVAFAAPQTVAPGPPALEVGLAGDGNTMAFSARVRIKTAAGAKVSRVDLHRVRVAEAANSVDTMGPPLVTITASASGYTVVPTPAGNPDNRSDDGRAQTIGTISGNDAVPGSWKPVFYRAVAWGTDDPDRGQYGTRSEPSVPRQVVVPPATPPDLGPLGIVSPTSGSPIARIDVTSTAPIDPTPLGAHVLEAEVVATDAAGISSPFPLAVERESLDRLPTTQPGAGASGLWRDATSGGSTTFHLLVRRADVNTTLRVRVRLTDPIGRLSEHTVVVPTGSPATPPDILTPTLHLAPSGTILTFTTSVPNDIAGVGDYTVDVVLRPARGRRITRTETMAAIQLVKRGEDIFSEPSEVMPMRRTRRSVGSSSIAVGLRTAGEVTVVVAAPDGTQARITRTIGGPP